MASVAKIIYPAPTPKGLEEWTYAHQEHHDAIEDGIAARFGIAPVKYRLFPMFKDDISTWLAEHVAAHQRMRQYLEFGGQDLSNWDVQNRSNSDAWIWSNYIDHLAAGQRLGTTIT